MQAKVRSPKFFSALLAFGLLLVSHLTAHATACRYVPGAFQKAVTAWAESCKTPLCGTIHVTDPKKVLYQGGLCDGDPWLAFSEDIGKTIANNGVILLGEVHDNAAHHAVRAHLVEAGKAAVFEQLRTDQQPTIDALLEQRKSARPLTADDFFAAVAFDKSGWEKDKYAPLFNAVLAAKLPIFAGDPVRDLVRKVAKEGEGGLSTENRAELKLNIPLGAKLDDASLTEIEQAHCGVMLKSALGGIAFAQRYRDAHIADATLTAAARHGVTLVFTGNGHVRTDRGVPWYIRERSPETKVISVMLIEVEDGKTDPEAYVPRDLDGKPAADYIVFTPRAEHPDPCEKMREKANKPNP